MTKTFKLKHRKPEEVLDQVHRSGIFHYMFTWNYTINPQQNAISFTIRYAGGENPEEEKRMMRELESYIRSIDSE